MSPLLLGAALGATGAFIFDPQQGPRRRALVRNRVTTGLQGTREFAKAARSNRRIGAESIAGAASVLYAFARGGIGAVVPLAVGAALLACALKSSAQ
jgi:hypothetical protein